MAVICPKCGFEQEEGARCDRCGFILGRYGPPTAGPPPAPPILEGKAVPQEPAVPSDDKPKPGPFRRFYRVFRWVALAAALIALYLLLRPSPPPSVRTDPQAAERIQEKLDEMERVLAQGQPHDLQLTEAEVNVWVQSSLAPETRPAPGGSGTAAPPAEPTMEQVRSSMRDIRINLVGDEVHAYVLFNLYGKDISLELEGHLFVADGRLRLQPTSGKLGSMPIPKLTLDRAVSRLFDSPENQDKFLVPPHIKDIRVVNGELVVSYQ